MPFLLSSQHYQALNETRSMIFTAGCIILDTGIGEPTFWGNAPFVKSPLQWLMAKGWGLGTGWSRWFEFNSSQEFKPRMGVGFLGRDWCFSLFSRHSILVFCQQICWQNSDRVTCNSGKYK